MLTTLLALLLSLSAQTFQPRSGEQLAASLLASGLPVENVTIRTAETDSNNLLGRPHQYVAKISWRDIRFEANSDNLNCTVEAFDAWPDYIARINYVRTTYAAAPILFAGAWAESSDSSMTVLRMDKAITPAAAEQYRAWLGTL
jgi:hypothetical protein